MIAPTPIGSGASVSGSTGDKWSGILAGIIGIAGVAGVIVQLTTYSVANNFYGGYGLNASVVGLTPFNAVFRLSSTWIWIAFPMLLSLAIVLSVIYFELRRIERGDPAADKGILLFFYHDAKLWRPGAVAITLAMLSLLCGPVLSLGLTSARFGQHFAQGIDPYALTPNSSLWTRMQERAENLVLWPLARDLQPITVSVSWPTPDKVPASLSDELPSRNDSSSAAGEDTPSSPESTLGANPLPNSAVPGFDPILPEPIPPAGEDPPEPGDNGGSFSRQNLQLDPTKKFRGQLLGDNGDFRVIYFPRYKVTLFVKFDDVSMSVSLPRNSHS